MEITRQTGLRSGAEGHDNVKDLQKSPARVMIGGEKKYRERLPIECTGLAYLASTGIVWIVQRWTGSSGSAYR